MSFRQAIVLASTCFFLGILFICFNVDQRLLWGPPSVQTLEDARRFYTTVYHAPPGVTTLMHSMMGFGILGLVMKLHKWDELAMYFDGSSLAAYVLAMVMYLSVGVPALRAISEEGLAAEEREEASRVLAACNVIEVLLLVGVLVLQVGQEYTRRTEPSLRQSEEKRPQEVLVDKKTE